LLTIDHFYNPGHLIFFQQFTVSLTVKGGWVSSASLFLCREFAHPEKKSW